MEWPVWSLLKQERGQNLYWLSVKKKTHSLFKCYCNARFILKSSSVKVKVMEEKELSKKKRDRQRLMMYFLQGFPGRNIYRRHDWLKRHKLGEETWSEWKTKVREWYCRAFQFFFREKQWYQLSIFLCLMMIDVTPEVSNRQNKAQCYLK